MIVHPAELADAIHPAGAVYDARPGNIAQARAAKSSAVVMLRRFPRGTIRGVGITSLDGRPAIVVNVIDDPATFESVRRRAPSTIDGVPVVLMPVGDAVAYAPSGDALTDLVGPLLASPQLTAIADRLADRLVNMLQSDKALQREVGAAAGGALMEPIFPYVVGLLGVLAGCAVIGTVVIVREKRSKT